MMLDTNHHVIGIDIVKLPPNIKPVLTHWGSIFVCDDGESEPAAPAQASGMTAEAACVTPQQLHDIRVQVEKYRVLPYEYAVLLLAYVDEVRRELDAVFKNPDDIDAWKRLDSARATANGDQ
jgi:hypothetical protein